MRYKTRPHEVEAIRTDGTVETANRIREWSHEELQDHWTGQHGIVAFYLSEGREMIYVYPGDWIIRNRFGTYETLPHDIFIERYVEVHE